MSADPTHPDPSEPAPIDPCVWHEWPVDSAFGRLLGPFRRRRAADRWDYGLVVHDGLRNEAGILHGGAIAALIDEVIGTVVREVVGRRHVTVQMATTFLKAVYVGDFVEPTCRIVKVTRTMTFVDAIVSVGGEVAATATLIFKARETPPQV